MKTQIINRIQFNQISKTKVTALNSLISTTCLMFLTLVDLYTLYPQKIWSQDKGNDGRSHQKTQKGTNILYRDRKLLSSGTLEHQTIMFNKSVHFPLYVLQPLLVNRNIMSVLYLNRI